MKILRIVQTGRSVLLNFELDATGGFFMLYFF